MMSEIASHDSQLIPAGPSSALGEAVPDGEAADIQAIVGLVEAHVREAAKGDIARRDAHAKGHGCVRAEFQVWTHLRGLKGRTEASRWSSSGSTVSLGFFWSFASSSAVAIWRGDYSITALPTTADDCA
jgi:hypothetical protein